MTGELAGCIREVATVATPDNLPRWLRVLAYRGCLGEPGPSHGRDHGIHYPTSPLSRARPTPAQDEDELGAVPEAALGASATFGTAEVATGHGLVQMIAPEPALSRQGGAVLYRERLGDLPSSSGMTEGQCDAQRCFSTIEETGK